MKELSYTDEKGNKLYGFSQTSLDDYNKRLDYHSKVLKTAIVVGGFIGIGFLILSIFILYQIMKYDIFTHAIRIIAGVE